MLLNLGFIQGLAAGDTGASWPYFTTDEEQLEALKKQIALEDGNIDARPVGRWGRLEDPEDADLMRNRLIAMHNSVNRLAIQQEDNAYRQLNRTRLLWAVAENYEKTTRYLIENWADIDAIDSSGNNALMLAAANGNLKMVRYLVEEVGIDINRGNNHGMTALEIAAEEVSKRIFKGEHLNVVKYLLSKKSDYQHVLDGQGPYFQKVKAVIRRAEIENEDQRAEIEEEARLRKRQISLIFSKTSRISRATLPIDLAEAVSEFDVPIREKPSLLSTMKRRLGWGTTFYPTDW